MKLVELTVNDFIQVLASDAPAPGGGSVSALAAANGAALSAMVARLTVGKKKYAEFDSELKDVITSCSKLQEELILAVDRDTEAFNLVSAAFKMPKETEEEKALRSQKIQEGTLVSTEVPFHVMELTLQTLHVAKSMLGKFNVNAASDLGVAALNLVSAVKGAWLNVLINISSLKDSETADSYRSKGTAVVKEAEAIGEEIYQAVLNLM